PPEISSGSFDEMSDRPSLPIIAWAAADAAAAGHPASSSGSATFSSTLSGGRRLGPWNARATGPGRSCSRAPRAGDAIAPPVGRSMPAMMCSSDDLPLPDGPTSATLSPARTSNVAAAIATTASGPLPNSRDSPLARTRTSLIGDPAVHQVHDAVGGLRHVAAVGDHQHG